MSSNYLPNLISRWCFVQTQSVKKWKTFFSIGIWLVRRRYKQYSDVATAQRKPLTLNRCVSQIGSRQLWPGADSECLLQSCIGLYNTIFIRIFVRTLIYYLFGVFYVFIFQSYSIIDISANNCHLLVRRGVERLDRLRDT